MATPYVGEIRTTGFNFAPPGWFLCNGQSLSISEYTTLFAVIGTTYGGNGQTTFNLPNLQGATPLSQGQGPALPAYVMGQTGGAVSVTVTSQTMPAHQHPVVPVLGTASGTTNSPANTIGVATAKYSESTATPTPDLYAAAPTTGATEAAFNSGIAGSGLPLSVQNPFQVISFMIAWAGIYPTQN